MTMRWVQAFLTGRYPPFWTFMLGFLIPLGAVAGFGFVVSVKGIVHVNAVGYRPIMLLADMLTWLALAVALVGGVAVLASAWRGGGGRLLRLGVALACVLILARVLHEASKLFVGPFWDPVAVIEATVAGSEGMRFSEGWLVEEYFLDDPGAMADPAYRAEIVPVLCQAYGGLVIDGDLVGVSFLLPGPDGEAVEARYPCAPHVRSIWD